MRLRGTSLAFGLLLTCGPFAVLHAEPVVPGSTAFCLYEVPIDETGKRRWINLGIVQYVEANSREIKIYYGGGAFGSGHEARIPVNSVEESQQVLEKLRRIAAACR